MDKSIMIPILNIRMTPKQMIVGFGVGVLAMGVVSPLKDIVLKAVDKINSTVGKMGVN